MTIQGGLDFGGISLVIPAVVAAIGGISTTIMQIVNWWDARRTRVLQEQIVAQSDKRTAKIDSLHKTVNGQMDRLLIKATKEAFEQGRKFERDSGPTSRSPRYPRPKVEALLNERQQLADQADRTALTALSTDGAASGAGVSTAPATPAAPDQARATRD